jgi:hypothetical protein
LLRTTALRTFQHPASNARTMIDRDRERHSCGGVQAGVQ